MPTDARHIALYGVVGVGKSTLVARVVQALGVAPGGIVTRFDDRARSDRVLLIGDGRDMRPAVRFEGGRPASVDREVFDGYGAALLARPAAFYVLDELGRFEADARAFQNAVLGRIEERAPVLAVVRPTGGHWPDWVLGHPRVRAVGVTKDNRDALVAELKRHFLDQGGDGP